MDAINLGFYRHDGHVTVNGVFAADEMDAVTRDLEQWGEAFLSDLPPAQRARRIDPCRSARGIGDGMERNILHHQAIARMGAQMRPRGDQLRQGGFGRKVFGFGGHAKA